MFVSKGTVSSIITILRDWGKTRTRSGRWEVQRTFGGIVVPDGERQPGKSAKISGEGESDK